MKYSLPESCHVETVIQNQNTCPKFAHNNGSNLCSLDVTKHVCVSRDPSVHQKRLFKMRAQWMSHLLREDDYSVHFSRSCHHSQLLQHRSFLSSVFFHVRGKAVLLYSVAVLQRSRQRPLGDLTTCFFHPWWPTSQQVKLSREGGREGGSAVNIGPSLEIVSYT